MVDDTRRGIRMASIAPRGAMVRAPLRLPYQRGILYHNIKRFPLVSRRDAVHEKEDSLTQFDRIAFMSYAHENNHDRYLSKLRAKLELAVRDRMGTPFTLFQDLVHIHAGHKWEDRVKQYLSRSTLLLPIISPYFYNSEWCRKKPF